MCGGGEGEEEGEKEVGVHKETERRRWIPCNWSASSCELPSDPLGEQEALLTTESSPQPLANSC